MKNKEQAFTLVELLAVIVILAIILLIAVPNVIGIIGKSREDIYKTQIDMIGKMTEAYIISNNILFDEFNQVTITLKDLIDEDFTSEITDPRCGKKISGDTKIVITKDENENILSLTLKTQRSL